MTRVLSIDIKGKLRDFSTPWVMGIVNVTPDSFFSGSRVDGAYAVAGRVEEMLAQGADCIDLGAYSSRPGAADVSPEEEWRRLDAALAEIRRRWPDLVVSIDTFRASVARKCVEQWGADIINDISGGDLDPDMFTTVADLRVPYILMHMRGNPQNMQTLTEYDDVTADVISGLASKVVHLRSLGVNDIILDPGFGFAKTVEQNYRLLHELGELKRLGLPVLAGMSRKTMIWKPLGITPEEALEGTVALDTVALLNGADILRVHDVAPAVQTVRLIELYKKSRP